MKRTFELVNFPNQRFSTLSNGYSVEFTFRTFRGIVYASIYIDNDLVCAGRPCLPNRRIFPKPVETLIGASAYFACETDDYPSYEQFNTPACVFTLEDL